MPHRLEGGTGEDRDTPHIGLAQHHTRVQDQVTGFVHPLLPNSQPCRNLVAAWVPRLGWALQQQPRFLLSTGVMRTSPEVWQNSNKMLPKKFRNSKFRVRSKP